MPFTSPDPDHKPFSIKKLTEDEIQTIIDLRYPVDEDQKPLTYADIALYILNTYDMDISIQNVHTFIKKKRLSTRIANSKAALREISDAKIVKDHDITKVIFGVGSLLLDIAQDQQSAAAYSTVVNAMTKYQDSCIKMKELELKEKIQADGQNINLRTNSSPSREELQNISREIGLL
jgi:hypothetical protein